MDFHFLITDDGKIPSVIIDGRHLALISLTYSWHTKTDKVADGANVCVADGCFDGELVPRRFVFDILGKWAREEPYIDKSGRVFEVCVEPGTSSETEVWKETAFLDIKVGNIIRILENGEYYTDQKGDNLWVVNNIAQNLAGIIDCDPLPAKHPEKTLIGDYIAKGLSAGIEKPTEDSPFAKACQNIGKMYEDAANDYFNSDEFLASHNMVSVDKAFEVK